MTYDYSRTKTAATVSLDKLIRFQKGYFTVEGFFREYPDSYLQTGLEPKLRFDRVKFNRLSGDEQDEYERDTKVPSKPYFSFETPFGEAVALSKKDFEALKRELKIRVVTQDRKLKLAATTQPPLEKVVKRIKNLTDNNDHLDAILEAAKFLDLQGLQSKVLKAVRSQQELGHLPGGSNNLYQELMGHAKELLSPTDLKLLRSGF